VFAHADAAKVRGLADDVRDGTVVLPIGRAGKILLLIAVRLASGAPSASQNFTAGSRTIAL
ncbi:MAG: hypothetical protein M3O06_02575, partial [Pseudomonadota bacterium]|nr:hypothetical protein [Pseudomonadota bacterium]